MRKYLRIVQSNKLNLGARFVNYIIDSIVVQVLFFLFGVFAAAFHIYLGVSFFYELVFKLDELNRFENIIVNSIVYFFYIFTIEYFTKGRSIGKYITGSKVVSVDGDNPTMQQYLIRSLSRIVPFDGLSFLFSEDGWHDNWSDTRVIKISTYENERNLQSDLSNLGKGGND